RGRRGPGARGRRRGPGNGVRETEEDCPGQPLTAGGGPPRAAGLRRGGGRSSAGTGRSAWGPSAVRPRGPGPGEAGAGAGAAACREPRPARVYENGGTVPLPVPPV